MKVSLRNPLMLPTIALVDPLLTRDLPPALTAATGLDALAQLIEPFVCVRANPMTDAFCREGQLGLRPYPLVKGYLQSQMATAETGVQLIVLDYAGPRENSLQAATMEAVLDAQQNQATHVTATHELTFDQELNSYRLESYS